MGKIIALLFLKVLWDYQRQGTKVASHSPRKKGVLISRRR